MLPGIAIDAQVGQQLYQVQRSVAQLKAEGAVGDRLILELGTNGPYTVSQLEHLINSFGPLRRIVLVNTRVPRPWQDQVNETIAAVAETYPNATVVDWYGDSAAYPSTSIPTASTSIRPGPSTTRRSSPRRSRRRRPRHRNQRSRRYVTEPPHRRRPPPSDSHQRPRIRRPVPEGSGKVPVSTR